MSGFGWGAVAVVVGDEGFGVVEDGLCSGFGWWLCGGWCGFWWCWFWCFSFEEGSFWQGRSPPGFFVCGWGELFFA